MVVAGTADDCTCRWERRTVELSLDSVPKTRGFNSAPTDAERNDREVDKRITDGHEPAQPLRMAKADFRVPTTTTRTRYPQTAALIDPHFSG